MSSFFARIDAYILKDPHEAQRPDETIFGNAFPADEGPHGMQRTQQVMYGAVKDFRKVLVAQNVDIQDLDVWFRNFAKWMLVPTALFEDEKSQTEAIDVRTQLCQKVGVPVRQCTPATLATYTN